MPTWKTVTVGTTGTYATLNAAQAAEATDLTAQSGDLVISCQAFEDTTQAVFSSTSWDTDATHRVIVRAANAHLGSWSTGVYRMAGVTTRILNQAVDYMVVDGVQFEMQSAGSVAYAYAADTALNAVGASLVDKCIAHGVGSTATAGTLIYNSEADHDVTVRNSVLYAAKMAIGSAGTGSKIICENVTIDDCDIGVYVNYGGHKLTNTRITNCTNPVATGAGNLDAASDYNLTNSSTAITNFGANSITSADSPTIAYVDSTSTNLSARDYHLAVGDSGIGAGVSLSTAFTDDIDGDTRG